MSLPIVLLPGLDGTGRLFAPLLAALHVPAHVIAYPTHESLDVAALSRLVEAQLPAARCVIVAESFSGLVAATLAARAPHRVAGLVLVASFVRSPLGSIASLMAQRVVGVLRLPLASFVVRALLVGRDAAPDLVAEVKRAVASVEPDVLVDRFREVLALDVSQQLSSTTMPLLLLCPTADRLVSRRSEVHLRQCRPDLRVVRVDAPHLVLQRRPREAAEAIEAFADALPAT